jgi:putative MATE family efflux protein
VAEDGARYLSIVGAAFPAFFISASVSGTFSGSGNSRIAFVSNAAGLAINMALDPLLIFYFNMGLTGAAVATVIAQVSVAAIFLTAIKKSPGRPFAQYSFRVKPERQKINLILRWCLPVVLESLLFTALSMAATRLVTAFGAEALAAQRVGSQIESLSWLIGGGFGTALTAFTGQNYGAGNWARIRRGFRISLWMMTSWGVIVTFLLFFGGRQLFSIFLSGGEVLDIGEHFMKIMAFCQIFACFEAVAAGVFRGIGKTVPPSLSSIICNALRVPLAYFLSLTPLGLNGIFAAMSLGAAARGAMVLAWYLTAERSLPKVRGDLEVE